MASRLFAGLGLVVIVVGLTANPGCIVRWTELYTQTEEGAPDQAGSGGTPQSAAGDPGRAAPAGQTSAAPGETSPGANIVEGETAVVAAPPISESSPVQSTESDAVTESDSSGALTAGSFDDNLNLDVFRSFLSEVLQGDDTGQLPNIPFGERILVRVRDRLGLPVGDARVVISTPGPEGLVLVDRTTGSDGRLVFLTGLDDPSAATTYALTVYPPDGSNAVIELRDARNVEWDVTFGAALGALPTMLDLAFVIDTTRSMKEELDYLKAEVGQIAQTIAGLYPDVRQRYGLVVYRDRGDVYVVRSFDFTSSLDGFLATLGAQTAAGGGDVPEALHSALEKALELSWQPPGSGTARIMFLMADAPPHIELARRTFDAIQALRGRSITIHTVAASVSDNHLEFFLRVGAFLTLGQYAFLTGDAGVGVPYERPDLPCYQVEQLSQLMTRLVAGALSGTRLEAEPANVLRTVGNPVQGVCTPVPVASEQ